MVEEGTCLRSYAGIEVELLLSGCRCSFCCCSWRWRLVEFLLLLTDIHTLCCNVPSLFGWLALHTNHAAEEGISWVSRACVFLGSLYFVLLLLQQQHTYTHKSASHTGDTTENITDTGTAGTKRRRTQTRREMETTRNEGKREEEEDEAREKERTGQKRTGSNEWLADAHDEFTLECRGVAYVRCMCLGKD